jgi:hypothetical protein
MVRRRWFRSGVAGLPLVVLAASDALSSDVGRFWTERPMFAAIVSGGLLLLLTVLVVDALLETRRARGTRRVLVAAYSDLTTRTFSAWAALDHACGTLLGVSRRQPGGPRSTRERLKAVLATAECWTRLAPTLREVASRQSEGVAEWSPALLPYQTHAEVLDAYAHMASHFAEMLNLLELWTSLEPDEEGPTTWSHRALGFFDSWDRERERFLAALDKAQAELGFEAGVRPELVP